MNRNRGWFILMLVVAAFLTVCFSPVVRGQDIWELARIEAKEIINKHLQDEPDCDTKHLPDIIDKMEIRFEYHINCNVSAWVFNGVLFINNNPKIKRSWRGNIITIMHEAVHFNMLCLNDSIRSYDIDKPICKLFGKPVYHSMDIDSLIKSHLRKELNNENTISSK